MSFNRNDYYTFQEMLAKYDVTVSQSIELHETLPKTILAENPDKPGKKETYILKTDVEALNLSLRQLAESEA